MVNIRDIAKKVGVSPSTVSRALNDDPKISEETKKKVKEIAKRLRYKPNQAARSLITRETKTIGFLILKKEKPLVADPFYSIILYSAQNELHEMGYHLLYGIIPHGKLNPKKLPRMLQEERIDGLILAGPDMPQEFIESIRKTDIPLILVDNYSEKVDSVLADNVRGAYIATKYLIDLGHKNIAFASGPLDQISVYERWEGYKKALMEANIEYNPSYMVEEKELTMKTGRHSLQLLWKNAKKPTAILAANDPMALGIIQCAKNMGIKVPEELSVIGIDDIEISSQFDPPLTTIRIFKEEMGLITAKRLIDRIKNPNQPPIKIIVSTELIIRGSTAFLRN
ncbi:MAG: LacI family transcriptional regulator [Dictyoglomaceae bacterium]|nr:LacI family transcriptional regulator [Dictyoglomaceae bacterium]